MTGELTKLAQRINTCLDRADAARIAADAARIEAGRLLLQAKQKFERWRYDVLHHVDGGVLSWKDWCEAHIDRSWSDIKKVMALAEADDPPAALQQEREKARMGMQASRAKMKARAATIPKAGAKAQTLEPEGHLSEAEPFPRVVGDHPEINHATNLDDPSDTKNIRRVLPHEAVEPEPRDAREPEPDAAPEPTGPENEEDWTWAFWVDTEDDVEAIGSGHAATEQGAYVAACRWYMDHWLDGKPSIEEMADWLDNTFHDYEVRQRFRPSDWDQLQPKIKDTIAESKAVRRKLTKRRAKL